MWWLLKARVRPGADFELNDALAEAQGAPYVRELRKALDARPNEEATFYFPVEGRDPEESLDEAVLDRLEIVSTTRIREVSSWGGDEDDDEEDEKPKGKGRGRPPPRRRS